MQYVDQLVLEFNQETSNTRKVLERFNKNCMDAETAMRISSDDRLFKPWTIQIGEKILFTVPRLSILCNFILNHFIHHCAQMCIYIRLNNTPIPAIYGPTADEDSM